MFQRIPTLSVLAFLCTAFVNRPAAATPERQPPSRPAPTDAAASVLKEAAKHALRLKNPILLRDDDATTRHTTHTYAGTIATWSHTTPNGAPTEPRISLHLHAAPVVADPRAPTLPPALAGLVARIGGPCDAAIAWLGPPSGRKSHLALSSFYVWQQVDRDSGWVALAFMLTCLDNKATHFSLELAHPFDLQPLAHISRAAPVPPASAPARHPLGIRGGTPLSTVIDILGPPTYAWRQSDDTVAAEWGSIVTCHFDTKTGTLEAIALMRPPPTADGQPQAIETVLADTFGTRVAPAARSTIAAMFERRWPADWIPQSEHERPFPRAMAVESFPADDGHMFAFLDMRDLRHVQTLWFESPPRTTNATAQAPATPGNSPPQAPWLAEPWPCLDTVCDDFGYAVEITLDVAARNAVGARGSAADALGQPFSRVVTLLGPPMSFSFGPGNIRPLPLTASWYRGPQGADSLELVLEGPQLTATRLKLRSRKPEEGP
jgi:hypothetical protein